MADSRALSDLASLRSFDHQPRTRLVFGVNSANQVGQLVRELGARKVLLVTDPGLVAAGHAGHIRAQLEGASLQVALFDRARENPTTRCVEDCLALARAEAIDAIIGLGGGSAMDTAKGCNFLTNGGRMQDYWGRQSDQSHAALSPSPPPPAPANANRPPDRRRSSASKDGVLDPKAAARIAILDPLLTLSQPERVTACTGIDAIAHAVETAVAKKATRFP
jgi:alcohol dehydrogenase